MPMPQYSEQEEETASPDVKPMDQPGEQPEEQPVEEGAPQEAPNEHTLFISPEHLGGLDPNDINPGDILEFKVVGRDADGDIEVEYNTGKGNESGMDRMKSDLREHMMQPTDNPGIQPGGSY